jgi:hypothetical protein
MYTGAPDGEAPELWLVYLMTNTRRLDKVKVSAFWRDIDPHCRTLVAPNELVNEVRTNLRDFNAKRSALDIHGFEDTAAAWSWLTLRVLDGTDSWGYELPLGLSGFYGKDAALLDSLLKKLIGHVVPQDCWLFDRLSVTACDASR